MDRRDLLKKMGVAAGGAAVYVAIPKGTLRAETAPPKVPPAIPETPTDPIAHVAPRDMMTAAKWNELVDRVNTIEERLGATRPDPPHWLTQETTR